MKILQFTTCGNVHEDPSVHNMWHTPSSTQIPHFAVLISSHTLFRNCTKQAEQSCSCQLISDSNSITEKCVNMLLVLSSQSVEKDFVCYARPYEAYSAIAILKSSLASAFLSWDLSIMHHLCVQ